MKLSRNFTLAEMTKSQTATRLGIDNVPDAKAIEAMRLVCENILEPVRAHYGVSFSPSSGYRSPSLNSAIGGSGTSQHCKGEAVDFELVGVSNIDLARWIFGHLKFDQLILEFYDPNKGPNSGWVHVSYKAKGNRNQVLTIGRGFKHHGLPDSGAIGERI